MEELDRAIATGNVRITFGDRRGASERAEYTPKDSRVVLQGHPKIWQDSDVVTGCKISLLLREERSMVEGCQGERVNVVLYPKRGETPPSKPAAPAPRALRASGDDGIPWGESPALGRRPTDEGVPAPHRGVGPVPPPGCQRDRRPARPQRRRQDHDLLHDPGPRPADGGRVLLGGEDITRLPMYERARAGIGYLPQEPSVFRRLTVEENILAILETRETLTPRAQQERRDASCWRSSTSPTSATQRGMHALRAASGGGWRSRARWPRDPPFILLDEPFAGIDPIAVTTSRRSAPAAGARHRRPDHRPQRARDAGRSATAPTSCTTAASSCRGRRRRSPRTRPAREIYLGQRISGCSDGTRAQAIDRLSSSRW